MEVRNNLTQCPQGHFYNAAIYSSCPHCEGIVPDHFSETIDISNSGAQAGAFPPTMDPSGGYRSQGAQGSDGLDPFSSPTIIGGDIAEGNQVEPVVGWLVCIDGPVKGNDFRIHAGYNYIGREIGDIHIQGDLQISRQNHAMVAFDSSDGVYYVGPSAGRNLMKVNGKTVLNAVEIKNYDIISIGSTQLMFVALCGPHFSWNKGVES
ncbi:MAG: FHA domain-containing protein [Acetatifactor sp.]|nr:FHA domain-containing protein [Acetatifactor sp.]